MCEFYNTDVVDESGLNTVIAMIPSKKSDVFQKWMKNMETSLDEKSKQKAYDLFESGFIDEIEVGMVGLYGYDEAKRMATAQWYIFKPYREKGYAKEAITTLAKLAFDGKLFEMRETAWRNKYRRHFAKIDLIRADIRKTNIPSQKTAESCGFKYQYTDHRHYVIEGEGLEDAKIYELTPETLILP